MPRRVALPGIPAGAARAAWRDLARTLAVGLAMGLAAPAVTPWATAPASAQGADPTRILSALPGEVMFVRIAGSWASDDRRGPTRLVLIKPSPRDEAMRLYVQWLALDPRGNRFSLVATEEIPEIFDWRIKIDDYRIEPDANGSRVIFDAIVLTNNQRRTYVLTVGPPGDVMFAAR